MFEQEMSGRHAKDNDASPSLYSRETTKGLKFFERVEILKNFLQVIRIGIVFYHSTNSRDFPHFVTSICLRLKARVKNCL